MLQSETHEILVCCFLAISAGVMLLTISKKYNVPGIVLLLLGGFCLGPNGVNLVNTESLGYGLTVIASISIGIILFEGGLTLDLDGYSKAPKVIKRLLSIGVITTWLLSSLAVYLIFDSSLSISAVCGSLVIVTGPTVIGPLLRRIKVTNKLHNILHWEGVLIDPIGVFVAVLCYEWIINHSGQEAIGNFILRVVLGLVLGYIGGKAIFLANKHKLVPYDMVNIFALGASVLIFGLAESILAEAGLLAVTVAGFVLGINKPEELKRIKEFKAEITDLLIGTLFILLASRLSLEQFYNFGLKGIIVVAIIIFVVRPISIFLCTWKLDVRLKEKIFLCWIAPRGIVAASMASLFTLSLTGKVDFPNQDARFIETFVYSIIAATIILQGFSAGALAKFLGLYDPIKRGWIIVGAHGLGIKIAKFISKNTNFPVVLIDTKESSILNAKKEGLQCYNISARNPDAEDMIDIRETNSIGYFLAITDNGDLNTKLSKKWASSIDQDKIFRWSPYQEKSSQAIWSNLAMPTIISEQLKKNPKLIQENINYSENQDVLISADKDRIVLEKQINKGDALLVYNKSR